MTDRIDVSTADPAAFEAMMGLEHYLHNCGLPVLLIDLIKLRASQINGCSFCVDMHSHGLKAAGETDQRLWAVAAWRETPFFTPAERAALALTEEGTRLADREAVPDSLWSEAATHFTDRQLAAIITTIATINAWNRISVMTRNAPAPRP